MKLTSTLKLLVIVLFLNLFLPQYVSADIYDNFNDGLIDTNKWAIWEGYNTTPVVENNGVLNIDYPPSSKYARLTSKALFGGDFDFRVKWKDWQLDGTLGAYEENAAQIGMQVQRDDEFAYIFRGWFPTENGDQYISGAYIDDAWRSGKGDDSSPSDTSGYFGIERIGSTISTYYSDVKYSNYNNWNQLNQINNAFTEPANITLSAYTGDHTNSFHAEWDNVEVEADRIIIQEGLFSKEEKKQVKDLFETMAGAYLMASLPIRVAAITNPVGWAWLATEVIALSYIESKAFEWIIDHDPPSPEFEVVQEPILRNPEDFLYYDLSDQELKNKFLELMDLKLNGFGYLEAAFAAENNYSRALEAGDWSSAELQKDAFWKYLSSGLSMLDNSYGKEVGFMEYMGSNYNFVLTQEDLDNYLDYIENYGLPPDALDLFEQLSFDEEWKSEYLNFAQTFPLDLPTNFSEVSEIYLSGINKWEDIHNTVNSNAVPEPSSLFLLCSGLSGLYLFRKKKIG